MKRRAVYSRARRARTSGSSPWVGDRSLAAGAEWQFPEEPSLIAQGWGKVRGFCKRHDRVLLTLATILFCLGAVYGYSLFQPAPQHLTQKDIDGAVNYTLANRPPDPAEASIAAAIIAPSVVKVEGFVSDEEFAKIQEEKKEAADKERKEKEAAARKAGKPLPPPPEPETADASKEREADSVGTGVIVDDSGRILTNFHVVSSSERLVVIFADGSKSDAEVVGVQPEDDLAVIRPKILPDDMQPATLASTRGLNQGDLVVATGFPFGIGPSVSSGVISGLKRELVDGDKAKLTNLIQFDAAVNPGNSGGPLVNRQGEVVGIVTAIYNPTGQRVFSGIGFAVPIESAARAAGENPL